MIIIKSKEEIEKMAASNQLVAKVLAELREKIRAGTITIELDEFAESVVRKLGATPAFKGYRGYPKTICTSINEEVVHGIPSQRKLQEGDILSIDLGVKHNGYYGDAAMTVPVGRVSEESRRLLEVTEEALYSGIEKAVEGNHLYDISHAIQKCAESAGFSVVRDYVGHGIGTTLHEEPQVPNFGEPGKGPMLREGMVLAIEPMVNAGGYQVEVLSDNWTVVTADRSRSAHFEHTIAITRSEPLILSKL